MKIVFIGAGRMAGALMAGLKKDDLSASDIDPQRLAFVRRAFGAKIFKDNRQACAAGQVVVLAVKPQAMAAVLDGLRDLDFKNKLIISIAAGIPLRFLEKKLPGAAVIRAMPNNPCLVGAGLTALAKGKRATTRQLTLAKQIFARVGEVIVLPEKQLDAVTGLSGSGPAFVYQVIEALVEGGVKAGLSPAVAERLALQTVAGAVETVRRTVHSLSELRKMVTSPGGTTEAGLQAMEKYRAAQALTAAVLAAAKKSKVLSRRWGS